MLADRFQRDHAALGEARDQDAFGRDAARQLGIDQSRYGLSGVLDAGAIGLAVDSGRDDVVPGPHAVAAIDGNRAFRRVRQDEADAQFGRQSQLGRHRREIVAVGPEAMQPDDRGAMVPDRFKANGGQAFVAHAGLGLDNRKRGEDSPQRPSGGMAGSPKSSSRGS